MKALIATSKGPASRTKGLEIMSLLRQVGETMGVSVGPMYWTNGPGCTNLAMDVEGENAEKFVTEMTMVLMPARWCERRDEIPVDVDTINLQELNCRYCHQELNQSDDCHRCVHIEAVY